MRGDGVVICSEIPEALDLVPRYVPTYLHPLKYKNTFVAGSGGIRPQSRAASCRVCGMAAAARHVIIGRWHVQPLPAAYLDCPRIVSVFVAR